MNFFTGGLATSLPSFLCAVTLCRESVLLVKLGLS